MSKMRSKLEFGELADTSLLFVRGRWEEDGGGVEVLMVISEFQVYYAFSQLNSVFEFELKLLGAIRVWSPKVYANHMYYSIFYVRNTATYASVQIFPAHPTNFFCRT